MYMTACRNRPGFHIWSRQSITRTSLPSFQGQIDELPRNISISLIRSESWHINTGDILQGPYSVCLARVRRVSHLQFISRSQSIRFDSFSYLQFFLISIYSDQHHFCSFQISPPNARASLLRQHSPSLSVCLTGAALRIASPIWHLLRQ